MSVPDIERQLKKHGRTYEDVLADYLVQLMRHAESEMEAKNYAAMLKGTRRQYILTVPAVWSDSSKHITKSAAQRAGVTGDVILLSGKSVDSHLHDRRRV